jgi:signal transduction histidine kinase
MDHPSADALRNRQHGPVRWLRAHPDGADLILATFLTAISVAFHFVKPDVDASDVRSPTWWTVPLVMVAVLPIARRRINPTATAVFVVGVQVVCELLDVEGPGFIGVIVGVYSLGAHAFGQRRTHAVTAISILLVPLLLAGLLDDKLAIGDFISTVVVLTTAFVLGDNLRRRRDAAQSIQDRLERAERERELIARQRVTAERTRIARELHDVVAHSVSVMVIQAAAARRNLRSAPSSAEDALTNIEVTGRQTMNELRSILGVLRRSEEDDGLSAESSRPVRDLAPQPTLQSVSGLVDAAPDLPIALSIEGDIADLPTGVDLTGFRIVQEAITNVRRHAGPVTKVDVSIRRTGDHIDIEVADDGRGAAADSTGPGFGIVGMRERLDSIGGSLTASSQRSGGWHVRARLPIQTLELPSRTPSQEAAAQVLG